MYPTVIPVSDEASSLVVEERGYCYSTPCLPPSLSHTLLFLFHPASLAPLRPRVCVCTLPHIRANSGIHWQRLQPDAALPTNNTCRFCICLALIDCDHVIPM